MVPRRYVPSLGEADEIVRYDVVHTEACGNVSEELSVSLPEVFVVQEIADEGQMPGVLAKHDLGRVLLDGFIDAEQRKFGLVGGISLIATARTNVLVDPSNP